MISQKFKRNITKIPLFLDGEMTVYNIKQTEEKYHQEYLEVAQMNNKDIVIPFDELSISDRLRYEFEQREQKITAKVRIPQTKFIDSLIVCKIGNTFHRVYNAFHFQNDDGFPLTDVTFESYPNAVLKEDLDIEKV